jgi:hypothetical protein
LALSGVIVKDSINFMACLPSLNVSTGRWLYTRLLYGQ